MTECQQRSKHLPILLSLVKQEMPGELRHKRNLAPMQNRNPVQGI